MSEHPSPRTQASDEIDLGQLMLMIKNGLKALGNAFLRVFLFFKRNLFILLGLILLGVGISFALNQLISKKLISEVIVRPNFESIDYLEDVVEEINTNLITKDEPFLKSIGVRIEDAKGFEISLEEIADEEEASNEKIVNQMRYLETLNNLKDQGFVMDILRSELSEQSVVNYKLSFLYVDAEKGREFSHKIIDYINTNEYFNKIRGIYTDNAKSRIENNKKLILQIDDVVENYSNTLKHSNEQLSNKVFISDKETINVESLLNLKKKLLEDNEAKNLELIQQSNIVSVLNFGKPMEAKKPFFNDRFFKIPLILVLGFLAYCFVRYLNDKSKELA